MGVVREMSTACIVIEPESTLDNGNANYLRKPLTEADCIVKVESLRLPDCQIKGFEAVIIGKKNKLTKMMILSNYTDID